MYICERHIQECSIVYCIDDFKENECNDKEKKEQNIIPYEEYMAKVDGWKIDFEN